MHTAYIAMGANLDSHAGTPEATFTAAAHRLAALGHITAQSSLYVTAPVGYADQPEFLNVVIALDTQLAPHELLNHLLTIEQDFGRNRLNAPANGPRTLDLDIVLYGDTLSNDPELVLPHPRFAERAFVLVPLAEIAPQAIDPRTKSTIVTLLSACPEADRKKIRPLQSAMWKTESPRFSETSTHQLKL